MVRVNKTFWRCLVVTWLCQSCECEISTVSMNGIGSSAARQVMERMLGAYRLVRVNVVGNYTMSSSLNAIMTKVTSGQDPSVNVSFAAVFGQTPSGNHRNLVTIPVMAQAVLIIYNLANTTQLRLDKAQFVGIFSRTIKRWSDPILATAGIQLPDTNIEVWIRPQGSSGPLIRQLMAKYSRTVVPPHPKDYWPIKLGYKSAESAFGEAGAVAFYPNTIGFVGYATYMTTFMEQGQVILRAAWMPNNAGISIEPSPSALNDSLSRMTFNKNYQGDVLAPEGDSSYPLGSFLYIVVRKTAVGLDNELDCDMQAEILRYILWLASSDIGRNVSSDNYFLTLPPVLLATVVKPALRELRCGYNNSGIVWDLVKAQVDAEHAVIEYGLEIGITCALLLAVSLAIWCGHRTWQTMVMFGQAQRQIYVVPGNQILIIHASQEKYEEMMLARRFMEGRNSRPVFVVGEYQEDVVMLRRMDMVISQIDLHLRLCLVQLMKKIQHPNIARFYGLTQISGFQSKCFLISQFCPLGDLRTALNNKRNELDAPIKFGMTKGITEGLLFLHSKGIIHGNLRSTSVYLEADWTTKISDWDLTSIEVLADKFHNRERVARFNLSEHEETMYLPRLLWTAPEILRAVAKDQIFRPTKECDVYSFSIIFFEILTRDLPYDYHLVPQSMTYDRLLAMVRRPKNPLRPLDFKEKDQIWQNIPKSVIQIMRAGWSPDPARRPTIYRIREILHAVSSEMKRLADLTIVHTRAQIEQYKRNIIKNNEEALELIKDLENTKVDFLTRWIYELSLNGQIIEPRFYQVLYVLRCALVNYEALCTSTHGDAVLYFVDRFYRIIDNILPPDRNIHRLHSNGDEITIVAALPGGGVEYASKLAVLALDVLVAVWSADLLDIDWDRMEVRIALTCGPSVAGIYGNNHRSFTVVGAASDEASLVESAGATYRVLMSEAYFEALKMYPDFTAQQNNDDKKVLPGDQKTYWLRKKDNYKNQKILDDIAKLYPPPDARGIISETNDIHMRSRDRRKAQAAKASLQAGPTGSYIEKDLRSGYLIEHRDRSKEAASMLSIVQANDGHKKARARAAAAATKDVRSSNTPSALFGSMVGPQGFTALREPYRREKILQHGSLVLTQDHLVATMLTGQLGYRRAHSANMTAQADRLAVPSVHRHHHHHSLHRQHHPHHAHQFRRHSANNDLPENDNVFLRVPIDVRHVKSAPSVTAGSLPETQIIRLDVPSASSRTALIDKIYRLPSSTDLRLSASQHQSPKIQKDSPSESQIKTDLADEEIASDHEDEAQRNAKPSFVEERIALYERNIHKNHGEDSSRVRVRHHHSKKKKKLRSKQKLAERTSSTRSDKLRKTSLWVAQLPDTSVLLEERDELQEQDEQEEETTQEEKEAKKKRRSKSRNRKSKSRRKSTRKRWRTTEGLIEEGEETSMLNVEVTDNERTTEDEDDYL